MRAPRADDARSLFAMRGGLAKKEVWYIAQGRCPATQVANKLKHRIFALVRDNEVDVLIVSENIFRGRTCVRSAEDNNRGWIAFAHEKGDIERGGKRLGVSREAVDVVGKELSLFQHRDPTVAVS